MTPSTIVFSCVRVNGVSHGSLDDACLAGNKLGTLGAQGPNFITQIAY